MIFQAAEVKSKDGTLQNRKRKMAAGRRAGRRNGSISPLFVTRKVCLSLPLRYIKWSGADKSLSPARGGVAVDSSSPR